MNTFIEIINIFLELDKEYEESEKLYSFFSVFKFFNRNRKLPDELIQRINNFLYKKWEVDKTNCLQTEEDHYLLDQLPHDVQLEIFKKFLFQDFLH